MTSISKSSTKTSRLKTRIRPFTLLEILIALSLLLIAAGGAGWKMHAVLEKRRFKADLSILQSRIKAAHQMAFNCQADWEGVLKQNGKNWIFEAQCTDPPKSKSLPQATLHFENIFLNEKKENVYTFTFYSSGEISPQGTFGFEKDGKKLELCLPQILGHDAGDGVKRLGPIHPDDT